LRVRFSSFDVNSYYAIMLKEAKYFYVNRTSFSGTRQPQVTKWQPNFIVDVEENVDFRQDINLTVNKLSQGNMPVPKNSKYEKVKVITSEVFTNHYAPAVKMISELDISEGEYYLTRNNKDWYVIEYFSLDEKKRWSAQIDFRDGIEDLWLMVSSSPGHKGRPQARKKATAINADLFKQFLNLTVQFLFDSDSYFVQLNDFTKNFYALCLGDSPLQTLIINPETAFKKIIEQLETRRSNIEKRLIEVDGDPEFERSKLRGEIAGLVYALNVIKTSQ